MNESVSRKGCFVKLTVGATSRERSYRDESSAKKAYEALLFSKEARETFLRIGKVRRNP